MTIGRGNTILLALVILLSFLADSSYASGQIAPAGDMHQAGAERSTILTLTLNGSSWQLSNAALAALAQSSATVHNTHSKADETYTGIGLSDLLAHFGLTLK